MSSNLAVAIFACPARPSFVLLLYPVIDLSDDAVTHRGSRTNLTQDTPTLYDALSPQKHITRDTPPVFIVHGEAPSGEALATELRARGATATVTRPGLKIDLASLPVLARDSSGP